MFFVCAGSVDVDRRQSFAMQSMRKAEDCGVHFQVCLPACGILVYHGVKGRLCPEFLFGGTCCSFGEDAKGFPLTCRDEEYSCRRRA